MRKHTIELDNSGLTWCTTCKTGECALTTECCGRPITKEEGRRICDGDLDFIDGVWRSK